MRVATSLAALFFAGCAVHGPATPGSHAGGLTPEAWVDRALAPDLTRVLSTHPRFRGETLSLGLPPEATADSSRLDRALETRLEEHLIAEPGLRIRPPPASAGCGVDEAAYRIGFVTSTGSAMDTVQARIWDTQAAEWVAGVGGRWEGRLTGPDARAAASPAAMTGAPGSIHQPLPAGDPAPLAQALADRLECALAAAGLHGGPVTTAQEGVATLAAMRLSARLASRARPQPAWDLSVTPVAVNENHELVMARLVSDAGAVTASAYRSIRQSGVRSGAAGERQPGVAAPRLVPLPCGSHCVGVRAVAPGDAVLVAILAGRGLFSLQGCGSLPGGQDERSVRLRDPNLPWASFYAIAADARTRPALLALERRLPRMCGRDTPERGGDRRWLESLAALADEPSVGLAWNGLRVAAPARGEMP